jgi:hypothetical protein
MLELDQTQNMTDTWPNYSPFSMIASPKSLENFMESTLAYAFIQKNILSHKINIRDLRVTVQH